MSVVVMGYHNMGCIGIQALVDHQIPVSAVFTYRDNPKEEIWFDSVAETVKAHNIPVFFSDGMTPPEIQETILSSRPDLICSFYYRDIIPDEILQIPALGAVNLHGSLLPKYRGRCPVNWQLIHGERESGVTLHYMTARADAGDIIAQERVLVSEDDTALTLYGKLESAATRLLDEHLELVWKGEAARIPQDSSQATTFPGRGPEDGVIDWGWSTERIQNLVRAVSRPYPGAFTHLKGTKIVIWRVRPVSSPPESEKKTPGHVTVREGALHVETGTGAVIIQESTPDDPVIIDMFEGYSGDFI